MICLGLKRLPCILSLLVAASILFTTQLYASDWEWTEEQGWTENLGQARATPSQQLRYAYELEQNGEFYNASKQYFLLLKTFPDSEEAGIGLQRLANCLFQMENFYQSYKALEQVMQTYPDVATPIDLIRIEFLIARKFQDGARKNLLDNNEPRSVSLRTAADIYASVLDHDPFGPYAAPSLLALGDIHLELEEPEQAKVYYSRLLREFSANEEMAGPARIGLNAAEVLLGESDISDVKSALLVDKMRIKEAMEQGEVDEAELERATEYETRLHHLEEVEAKKLWDNAEFYLSRGSNQSVNAAIFTLKQIESRFARTSYAAKARRKLMEVQPPSENEGWLKLNLPFVEKKEETFVVPGPSADKVPVETVYEPIPGVDESPAYTATGAQPLTSGGSEVIDVEEDIVRINPPAYATPPAGASATPAVPRETAPPVVEEFEESVAITSTSGHPDSMRNLPPTPAVPMSGGSSAIPVSARQRRMKALERASELSRSDPLPSVTPPVSIDPEDASSSTAQPAGPRAVPSGVRERSAPSPADPGWSLSPDFGDHE